MKTLRHIFLLIAALLGLWSFSAPPAVIDDGAEDTQLIEREGFTLNYSYVYRQARWVGYTLTSEQLSGRRFKRSNKFLPDPKVTRRPVTTKDYRKSGFDRGHLAPSADMSYALLPMRHSFYMSNISPQLPAFNRGIWKRLEMQVREFALRENAVFVVTGPIFDTKNVITMGKTDIPVPCAFFKVVYDLTPPEKMIGFIVPNTASWKRIRSFAVTVDEVERETGLDFFPDLEENKQRKLESECDLNAWFPPAPRKNP